MNASVGLSVEDTDYSPAGLILQAIKYSPTQPEIKPGDTFETVGGNEQNRLTYVLYSFFSEDYQRMTNSFLISISIMSFSRVSMSAVELH